MSTETVKTYSLLVECSLDPNNANQRATDNGDATSVTSQPDFKGRLVSVITRAEYTKRNTQNGKKLLFIYTFQSLFRNYTSIKFKRTMDYRNFAKSVM